MSARERGTAVAQVDPKTRLLRLLGEAIEPQTRYVARMSVREASTAIPIGSSSSARIGFESARGRTRWKAIELRA